MFVMDLPYEIQEKILSYLDGDTLSVASEVCTLWKQLTKRLFWKLANDDISNDCLVEILGSNVEDRCVDSCCWKDVYQAWLQGRVLKDEPTLVTHVTESRPFTSYCITGSCLITSDMEGVATLYAVTTAEVINTLAETGSIISDLAVLDVARRGPYEIATEPNLPSAQTEHDFLIVMGPCYVNLYQMPVDQHSSGKLIWHINDLKMSIAKTSCFGSTFAVAEIPTNLTLREIFKCDKEISVNVTSVVACHTWVWKWKLWKDKVICVLATGKIAVWSTSLRSWISISERYSELLYQNPCFIFRGIIFCSSRTSQSLLEYWHCFPGDPYWLLCWNGEQFQKYYPKLIMGEDITAICIKRRMIVIGTATGKLCLYEHTSSDDNIGKFWNSNPVAVLQLADRVIQSCDFGFNGNTLTVVARTRKNLLMLVQWTRK